MSNQTKPEGGADVHSSALLGDMCPCANWCDADIYGARALTGHHASCPHSPDRLQCALKLIKELADGMTSWAQDCDGVHPDAWQAYRRAMLLNGVIVHDSEDNPNITLHAKGKEGE